MDSVQVTAGTLRSSQCITMFSRCFQTAETAKKMYLFACWTKNKRRCGSKGIGKIVSDGGLVTGTVLGEFGHRKQVHREERACRDAPKLVCGVAKVLCCDVSRPVVGTHVGASGHAGLVPVWLMDMMECRIHWQVWDLWARARQGRPFPGWIKNHSRRRTLDWCGLRFQGMFQTAAVTPIPYVLCDKESEVDNGKMNECLWIYRVCSTVGQWIYPESENRILRGFFCLFVLSKNWAQISVMQFHYEKIILKDNIWIIWWELVCVYLKLQRETVSRSKNFTAGIWASETPLYTCDFDFVL